MIQAVRNCNNEKEKVFSDDFKMKTESPEKVSINFHEVACTQHSECLFTNTDLSFKSNH